jgi:hypothetical protein
LGHTSKDTFTKGPGRGNERLVGVPREQLGHDVGHDGLGVVADVLKS